jgi:hypothetical protein
MQANIICMQATISAAVQLVYVCPPTGRCFTANIMCACSKKMFDQQREKLQVFCCTVARDHAAQSAAY